MHAAVIILLLLSLLYYYFVILLAVFLQQLGERCSLLFEHLQRASEVPRCSKSGGKRARGMRGMHPSFSPFLPLCHSLLPPMSRVHFLPFTSFLPHSRPGQSRGHGEVRCLPEDTARQGLSESYTRWSESLRSPPQDECRHSRP